MLVYANHLTLQGEGAEELVLQAVADWFTLQLGAAPRREVLQSNRALEVRRGKVPARLRIHATLEQEPHLYSWVLLFPDEYVKGRQWAIEAGAKVSGQTLELSCVAKTDEQSTLAMTPIRAFQPRLVGHLVHRLQQADDVRFAPEVPGVKVEAVGRTTDSYRALLADIQRPRRHYPIVLLSPTRSGGYMVDPAQLQTALVGLAQVVRLLPDHDLEEMKRILGEAQSVWNGAIAIFRLPIPGGRVNERIFLAKTVEEWGDTTAARISRLLAWVTSNTNVERLKQRIRPETVMKTGILRHLESLRSGSDRMNVAQLRQEVEQTSRIVEDQAEWIHVLEDDNSRLEKELAETKALLDGSRADLQKKEYVLQSLKDQLDNRCGMRMSDADSEQLLTLAGRNEPPTPLECIELIENLYGDRCVILDSARASAREIERFSHGRQLLNLLRLLVTRYRDLLIEGGDSKARGVFGRNEYAAKESETILNNKTLRRARTFDYRGKRVEMFRHLKIGVSDDPGKTIRVHFHWDADNRFIVIGHCGRHLPVLSR